MAKVNSLSQYINITTTIQTEWSNQYKDEMIFPWFRGHNSIMHQLVPGLYRDKNTANNEYDYRYDFKYKAFPFLSEAYKSPENEWDWYFLMQHYGLATRLLDWSEGSLVALFFALNYKTDDSNPCVWMLNPFEFNKIFHGKDEFFDNDDAECKKYLHPLWSDKKLPQQPIAIAAPHNSKRITAQKGCFTIHGSDTQALEAYLELKPHLKRIDINYGFIEDITDQLTTAGITESTLFPDLNGLSREVKNYWRMGRGAS